MESQTASTTVKSYDSLVRGYYHYYVAHLTKALRDEGAVPESNSLVLVNINWAICFNAVTNARLAI